MQGGLNSKENHRPKAMNTIERQEKGHREHTYN